MNDIVSRITTAENVALPRWNLDDLYQGTAAAELSLDIARVESKIKDFHRRHAGHLPELGANGLGQAIAEFEAIDETMNRLLSYASLIYAGSMSDPVTGQFYQNMQERVTRISASLVFFTLEINRLDETELQRWISLSPMLAKYRSWLRDTRIFIPHQLSDELERMLHEKYVVGRAAWNRLFDETIAALRFPINGAELTSTEALNTLTDQDPALRRQAGQVIGRVMGENVRIFALIINTLAKDKEIEDSWRNYRHPSSARNLSNRVEDAVVEALITAVKSAYPKLSHRYYALKARWFGSDRLDYWDRNAPLPDSDNRGYSWTEAREVVLDAYTRFSPELGAIGRSFFEQPWIDAEVRPGKAPGAFAHPTVPSVHPYLLLNYQGKTRDVMTLAHELGHGVHQILAGKQGHLMSDTPLTLAETASVFGEMLTFRALLDAQDTPKQRRAMLAAKVEDMINTAVRQVAFYDFEMRVHTERRQGEITADRLKEIWLNIQTESLGPTLRFDDGYGYYWTYIPHFVHSPFYVYAYAFGDCLVNSLYAVYRDAPKGFAERYIAMLSAGGTLRHQDLLAPFGLDATDPAFWSKGLSVLSGFIDELEAAE
ncbi:MAG: M3 family oligoendopeptidase [Rhodospirillaceae bacterium]